MSQYLGLISRGMQTFHASTLSPLIAILNAAFYQLIKTTADLFITDNESHCPNAQVPVLGREGHL